MNSPAFKLALAAGISLLALWPSQATAAATGSISGAIQGDATGDTCVRDVWVYDSAGNRVAGIDGRSTLWNWDAYKIEGLESGEYRLSFEQFCVDRLGPLPTGGGNSYVGEYFNDSPTLEGATPVAVVEGTETTGVDVFLGLGNAIEWEADDDLPKNEPEPIKPKARISVVKVTGPTTIRKGKVTTQRVKIANSGDSAAKQVWLKVKGRGISYRTFVGSIPAGATKIIKAKLIPGNLGKTTVKFKLTSSNGGTTSAERKIFVR